MGVVSRYRYSSQGQYLVDPLTVTYINIYLCCCYYLQQCVGPIRTPIDINVYLNTPLNIIITIQQL